MGSWGRTLSEDNVHVSFFIFLPVPSALSRGSNLKLVLFVLCRPRFPSPGFPVVLFSRRPLFPSSSFPLSRLSLCLASAAASTWCAKLLKSYILMELLA